MGDICLLVSSSEAQNIRRCLEKHQLVNTSKRLKFLADENKVAIPVGISSLLGAHTPSELDIRDIQEKLRQVLGDVTGNEVVLTRLTLPCVKRLAIKKPETVLKEELKKLLEGAGELWTDDISKDVPMSWEKHGDLALLPAAAFTLSVWRNIGDKVYALTARCLGCTRVAQKGVVCTDGYRTPQVSMLYGAGGWVEQVDNGIRYTYDVTKCMFSSGNISEKLRVAMFDCRGEVVVDMYAGIGYFTLPYLVYTGVKHLHACEWNPCAVEALRRNLELNNVQDRCTIHEGDNRYVCPKGIADRVNLGLIPSSRDGWLVACAALKPETGGILHIHYNVNTKPSAQAGTRSNRWESGDAHLKQSEIGNTQLNVVDSEPMETFRREAKCPLFINACQTNAYHVRETKISNADDNIDRQVTARMGEYSISCDSNELSLLEVKPVPCVEQKVTENNCCNDRHINGIQSSSIDAENSTVFYIEDKTNCDGENYIPELLEDGAVGKEPIGNDGYAGIHTEQNISCTSNTLHSNADKREQNTCCTNTLHSNADKHIAGKHCVDEMSKTLPLDGSCDFRKGTKGEQVSMNNPTRSHISDTVLDKIHTSKWFPWASEVSVEICEMLCKVHGRKWSTQIQHIEHVKSYAPFVDHIVLDLKCEPTK